MKHFLCWLTCQIPLHLTPKGFFHEQFSHKCFMMLSYIWTIRLCQPCHMLHMAIIAIMAQSDYIMPHGNQAIKAIMAILAQSDYIMPHATHGCPYCVMLWSSQQGRREKTPNNQVFIRETQKVFQKMNISWSWREKTFFIVEIIPNWDIHTDTECYTTDIIWLNLDSHTKLRKYHTFIKKSDQYINIKRGK